MTGAWRVSVLVGLLAIVCCLVPGSGGAVNGITSQKQSNYQQAAREIASQVVTELPDDIHFRLLGICPIEGDTGLIEDALTTAIKAKTNYHLIERRDLDTLLQEQGVQLSPIADPRQPVEPGKIKGVEGLLLGKVVKKQCNVLFCSLDVFFKLDDVEGGEVVFARDFSAHIVPQSTFYGLAGLIFLILCVLYAIRRRKKIFQREKKGVQFDADQQLKVQNLLKKARDYLNQAHDALLQQNRLELGVEVRQLRETLNSFLFQVEQAPGASPGGLNRREQRELKSRQAESLAGKAQEIQADAEHLFKLSLSAEAETVRAAAGSLQQQITDAAVFYRERTLGRS